MDVCRIAAFALLTALGSQAAAGDVKGPDRVTMMVTTGPTIITSGASVSTSDKAKPMKEAKGDGLAFVGSDGDIRGARFEQALAYYHAHYSAPHVSDMAFAQALAALP